jgi:hypothetical protein
MKLIILVAVMIMSSTSALACYSNLDCGVGGTCIKVSGSIDGVCSDPYGANVKRGRDNYYEDSDRGYTNNNYNSRQPSITDKDVGKECYSNMDCGIGGRCIKLNSGINGVCTK